MLNLLGRVVFKMVAGAFPVVKLMSLLTKQISKPIANAIKSGAKQNAFFRKYFCVLPGQGKERILRSDIAI